MKYREFFKLLIIIILVSVAGIIYVKQFSGKSSQGIIRDTSYDNTHEKGVTTATGEMKETEQWIYVQVCGQVNNPGVYKLSAGARVYEAVSMAGGFTDLALQNNVNQAQTMCDGEQIYVPAQGEETQPMNDNEAGSNTGMSGISGQGNLVNINTADVDKLKTLPGIGDARANAIISYRESNGSFGSIEDIKNVSGIKDAAFDKIKELICV